MENPEPLIRWPQPIVEYLGFLAAFLASGAVGFRYGVLRPLRRDSAAEPGLPPLLDTAARRAAAWGLVGATLAAALLCYNLPQQAARRHLEVAAFVTASPMVATQVILALVALVGFALARGSKLGWPLAAIAVIGSPLRAAFVGQWSRLVNPVHELAGGLWIGSLFVMLAAGLSTTLRSAFDRTPRSAGGAHGECLLSARAGVGRGARDLRSDHRGASSQASGLRVDYALRDHVPSQAGVRPGGGEPGRLELAPGQAAHG
jgi:hypothetical protein